MITYKSKLISNSLPERGFRGGDPPPNIPKKPSNDVQCVKDNVNMITYKSKLMSNISLQNSLPEGGFKGGDPPPNIPKKPSDDVQCVKCGGHNFSSGDFAVLPIKVILPQTVTIPLGAMYEITGLKLNIGDVICPKCFSDICNNKEPTIQVKEYCDVQCNVCQKKYSRSMGNFSWEGWSCATDFSPEAQRFYPGYGSGYDSDVFSILSATKLRNHWKNIDLSKRFIVCDPCLEEGVEKQFLKHKQR